MQYCSRLNLSAEVGKYFEVIFSFKNTFDDTVTRERTEDSGLWT